MPVSGNTVVKTYQAFALSETLLGKVVEAVKQGERDARRYAQLRSFEIYYHGHRHNLVLGRIFIIPAKLADSIEDFPSSLLYGTVIKEMKGETISDLYCYKVGESEFDVYDQKDLAAIKEKMFTDHEGILRSLVCFVPTWGNPRDYVVFKFTRDDAKLAMLIRHLIYGVYFDPRLSSAFELLSTDIANVDVTDVTPKLNYPFLGENILHQYPELMPGDDGVKKVASKPLPRLFLAAHNVDDFKDDLLAPGERSVIDSLTDKIKSKVEGTISTSEDVASKAASKVASEIHVVAQGKVQKERLLYGIPKGETERYMEVLLLTNADDAKIKRVKELATKDGFHSFREAEFDPSKPPDFTKSLKGSQKRATGDIDHPDNTDEPVDLSPVSALPTMLEAIPEAAAVQASEQPKPIQTRVGVLRVAGDTLEQHGMRLFAKSRNGHLEEVRVNGNRVRWTQPGQFSIAFRRMADLYVRNPRYLKQANRKVAEVPLTEDAIWQDKMDDLGPAPQVELPSQGAADADTTSAPAATTAEPKESPAKESPAPSKGESRLERMKERADPEGKKTWPWEKEGAKQASEPAGQTEAGNPWRPAAKGVTKDGRHTHNVWTRFTPENNGRQVYIALPVGESPTPDSNGYFTAESALQFRNDERPEYAPWKAVDKAASTAIGQCLACKQAVERATGSEVGPNLFLHRACQQRQQRLARLNFIPRQVIAQHYPELLKQATFNLFHPGPVQQEFEPELLHETVDHPESGYAPLIADVGPAADGAYVSTNPAGAIGIGRDGKPQVLDGAPLRKENDIRGYMFGDEFYSQTEGIDPSGLHAASVIASVRKQADHEDYKAQFKEFLKKAMGEVAASFIAAFKVTSRTFMDKIPGVGVIKLDQIEQPIAMGYNVQNMASRVAYLIGKMNDSDIQDAINDGWAQASVWNSSEAGGFVYEVFVRPESLDQDTLALSYSFVVGTKGL